jgi:hypothetical protein
MPDTDPLGNPLVAAEEKQPTTQPTSTDQGRDPLGNPLQPAEPKISDTYKQVMDTDPEKNARVQAVHAKTGHPKGFIANNLDVTEKAANAPSENELDSLPGSHPVIADWLKEPDNMALVHDAIPAMKKSESIWDDLGKGLLMTGSSVNKWLNQIDYNTGVLLGHNDFTAFKENSDMIDAQIKQIATPDGDEEWTKAIKNGDYGALGKKLVQQIPNIGMMVGLSPLGAAPLAGLIGTSIQADSYQSSLEKGISPDKALASAEFKGAVSGGAMMLPLGYFSKLFGPLAGELGPVGAKATIKVAAMTWLKTSLGMSAQNVIQTLGNAIADRVSGEDPHAFDDFGHKLLESAVGGFVTGGAMAGVGIVATAVRGKPLTPMEKSTQQADQDVKTAQTTKEKFLNVVADAKENALAKRSPDKFKEVMDKKLGPVDAYIPIEEWQILHQGAKQDPEEVAKRFGEAVHESYKTADQTGGNIKIPLSDLVTKNGMNNPNEHMDAAKGTPLEQLADHVKFDPTGKTLKEATEAKEEQQKIDEAKTAQEAEDEKAFQEYTKMKEAEITAVGGKKSMATNIAKTLKTYAEKAGVPFKEFSRRYKINFFSSKEPKISEAELKRQAMDMGAYTPKDDAPNTTVYVPKDYEKYGEGSGAYEDVKKKYDSRVKDLRGAGFKVTSKDGEGRTPKQIAQHWYELAEENSMSRGSLPGEWWKGDGGHADATYDTLRDIVYASDSGIETMRQMNKEASQILYQSAKDPKELPPDKQKEIFGASRKESAVDKVFGKQTVGDKLAKPATGDKQQSMFPGEAGGEQQTLFQRKLTPADFNRFLHAQRDVEGMKAAVKDFESGKIWTAERDTEGHNAAHNQAKFEGYKNLGEKNEGFLLKDGRFLTRDQADAQYGVRRSGDLTRETYYQKWSRQFSSENRGEIHMAGVPGERTFNIYVNENSDKSTFFHEPAHAFMEIFRDLATQEGGPQELKDDAEKMFKWLGVKGWEDITEEHKEQFARGYEYRLWEGKAPITGMRRIFDRFTQWMREVYPSAALMCNYLGVDMTDEMRGVYDRMVATSKEVDEAVESMGYNKEAPQGASPEEIEMWKKAQGVTRGALFDRIIKSKMDEITNVSHQQREQEQTDFTHKATEEVGKLPVFQADSYLKENGVDTKEAAKRLLAGKPEGEDEAWVGLAGVKFLGTDEPLVAAKMLSGIDREQEINERVDAHMAQFAPKVEAPKEVVQRAMYEGDAHEANMSLLALEKSIIQTRMIMDEALSKMPSASKQTTTEGKTEEPKGKPAVESAKETKPTKPPEEKAGEQLAREFGKQLKKNLEELPEVKRLRTEAMEAGRKQRARDVAFARSKAAQLLDGMQVDDAKNWKIHSTAARNAYAKAKSAEKSGDDVKAYQHYQEAILNSELANQSIKAAKTIAKSVSTIKGFASLERDPSRLTYGHWKAMKSMMENYEFKKKTPEQDSIQEERAKQLSDKRVEDDKITDQTGMMRDGQGWRKENLTDFIKRVGKTDENLAARLTDDLPKPNAFGKLTFGQLKDIRNNLAVIYEAGRNDRTIMIGDKKESLNDFAKETANQIADSVGKQYEADPRTRTDLQQKISKVSAIVKNGPLNIPQNLSEITGMGEFVPNLTKGYDVKMNEGYSEQLKNQRTIKEEFDGIVNEHYSKEELKKMQERNIPLNIGTSGKPELFSKWELFSAVRSQGSETGHNRLTTGNGYSDADLKTIIDHGVADERDYRFLKEWAKFDQKLWGRMVDTEQAVHNFEPKGVEKRPIETRFGIMEGMYHPLKYDYAHPKMAGKEEPPKLEERGQPLNPFLNKGMLKERVKNLPYPIRFDERVYLDHLQQTIKYLSWEAPLNDINKFINHPDVDAGIKAGFGGDAGGGQWLYHNHLDFAIHGDPKMNWADDKVNKFLSFTRTSNIIYHIAFRPHLYVVKAITDFSLISKEPGFGPGKAIQYFLASHPFSTKYGAIRNEVADKSEIQRSRHIAGLNFDTYTVNGIFKRYGATERAQKIGESALFWPEKLADRITDPMWKDIHDTLTSQGIDDKTAVSLANDKIAKIFGSGEDIYRSYPMRGHEIFKQASPAYTIFGAILNRAITQGRIKYILSKSEMADKPQLDWMIRSKIIGTQMFYYASAIATAEGAGQLVYRHKEEEEKIKKGYQNIKSAIENPTIKKTWETAKDTMGTLSLAALKLLPMGQRVSSAIQSPALTEKIVSSVPTGEFLYDVLKSGQLTTKAIEGKHLTDKELHDMMGGYGELFRVMPERIDAMIVNIHKDLENHNFSIWDLFKPISGKTAGRGGGGGR